MKKSIIALAGLITIVGCASTSPVGLVDINRITANWTEFQTDQSHLLAEEKRIATSSASNAQKASEAAALQKKYGALTVALTNQIRAAAEKVAAKKNMKLVLTREGVGYGGTDITAEVEKILGITETASPKPSGS